MRAGRLTHIELLYVRRIGDLVTDPQGDVGSYTFVDPGLFFFCRQQLPDFNSAEESCHFLPSPDVKIRLNKNIKR